MTCAIDYAKFFMKLGLDNKHNTYDGNMKLQKLLFFANFISLTENNTPLFYEPICAFENGCVVENVRLQYRNDYSGLLATCQTFKPQFSTHEYEVLNITTEIFGKLSAQELSDLNHSFNFWKQAYTNSIQNNGYNKDLAIITPDTMLQESDRLKDVISAYKENNAQRMYKKVIDGVTFYHNKDFTFTETINNTLKNFALAAEDLAYSIYIDNGSLVVL